MIYHTVIALVGHSEDAALGFVLIYHHTCRCCSFGGAEPKAFVRDKRNGQRFNIAITSMPLFLFKSLLSSSLFTSLQRAFQYFSFT